MHGFVCGVSDTDVTYCFKRGGYIDRLRGDGTAVCDGCEYHFSFVECGDSEEAEDEIQGIDF